MFSLELQSEVENLVFLSRKWGLVYSWERLNCIKMEKKLLLHKKEPRRLDYIYGVPCGAVDFNYQEIGGFTRKLHCNILAGISRIHYGK